MQKQKGGPKKDLAEDSDCFFFLDYQKSLFIEQSLVCSWKDFSVYLNLYQIIN